MMDRKAHYSSPDGNRVDIDFEHPDHGVIRMTISRDDYPELWAEVSKGDIAPFDAEAGA